MLLHQGVTEESRRAALMAAEQKAERLFSEIKRAGLIAVGRRERAVEEDIYQLAAEKFGVEKHWHKRIVRAGINTLTVAGDDPPVRIIAPDDLVYIDLGPVFEDWEADLGRTYVLGDNLEKHRLVNDLPRVFDDVQRHFYATPDIAGAELYAFAQDAAAARDWKFGGKIAGHIVSEFAHAHLGGNKDLNRISPLNPSSMRAPDVLGRRRHWILEIHLVERAGTFGGFYEKLI